MARGGPRPGAGRPPKAALREYTSPVREAERKILDRLPWIVDRLFDLAGGVTVEEGTRDGGTIVYQRPPDRQACEYLMDRMMGKPVQAIDLTVRREAERLAAELGDGTTADDLIREAEAILSGR